MSKRFFSCLLGLFAMLSLLKAQDNLYSNAKRYTLESQGLEREYLMYIPDSLAKERPLVFMLHGYGGKAEGYRPEMLETARRHGFALCIPQGYGKEGEFKAGWNVGYPVQANMPTDDLAFIEELVHEVQTRFGFGPDNTFYSGMSNGGDLAYMIALQKPGLFSAIASVAGLEMTWVSRTYDALGHVPFMEVHGTADRTSRWEGDPLNDGGWGEYLAVPIAVGNIIAANRCTYEQTTTLPLLDPQKPSRTVILHRYLGSPYGCEVRLYEVQGGKHSWHLSDLDTTEEIWNFFEGYLR